MAYTKIILGDIPEIMSEIIQYFRDDFSTLYSCIQVNRLWCRLTIPLLWECPFSLKHPKNYRYIQIYLHDLNDDDKTKLTEYGIKKRLFPSNTLFNYSSLIQHLDTYKVINSIEKWIIAVKKIKKPLHNFNTNSKRNIEFIKFIYKSLITTFIENEAILHTLDFTHQRHYFDIIVSLRSSNFFYNIKNLYLNFATDDTFYIKSFLKFLRSNCSSISSINFRFLNYHKNFEKNLSNIIESQKNLRNITFSNNSFPLNNSLLLSKNHSNYANTLRTIIFCWIDFKNMVPLNNIFEQLNVLESVHILYCYSLDSNFGQQIINLTVPIKLKSLFLCEKSIEPLQLLLQNSGFYLENLGLELFATIEENEMLEIITKYVGPHIKFLKYRIFHSPHCIYKILQLIEKVGLSLNYLTIESKYSDHLGSVVLLNLWRMLPYKMEYLNLAFTFNISDLEFFLKNLQTIFIKKLLIKNIRAESRERAEIMNILPYIKKYIMKKIRVEYFSFLECFFVNSPPDEERDDLFALKNEVKEFKLNNIIVQNYNDSIIDDTSDVHEFIREKYY